MIRTIKFLMATILAVFITASIGASDYKRHLALCQMRLDYCFEHHCGKPVSENCQKMCDAEKRTCDGEAKGLPKNKADSKSSQKICSVKTRTCGGSADGLPKK